MRVVLDECVDCRLASDLAGHDVKTVPEMGWATIRNGDLLRLAEREFDVFVTVDRNLSFQQNLPRFSIAVLVLHGKSNRLADLRPLIPRLIDVLPVAPKRPGNHSHCVGRPALAFGEQSAILGSGSNLN